MKYDDKIEKENKREYFSNFKIIFFFIISSSKVFVIYKKKKKKKKLFLDVSL